MNFPDDPARPPADAAVSDAADEIETTVDAFWNGRFHLVQPKGRGFRAGLDALLLASTLPEGRRGRAVDLGAGAGAISLACAVRCPALEIVLVEKDPVMAGLGRRSIGLPENGSFAARLSVAETNALAHRTEREAAGLADGAFSIVVTNPPFHPAGGRGSPDGLREAARTIPDAGFLARWIAVAAALLETSGLFAMVARPENLADILAGSSGRLGDLRLLPVHPREGVPANRLILHGRKGSRAGLSLLSPVVLHAGDGELTPLGRAIGAGEARIDLGLA